MKKLPRNDPARPAIIRFAEQYNINQDKAEKILTDIYYSIKYFMESTADRPLPIKRTGIYLLQAYNLEISRHSLRRWYKKMAEIKGIEVSEKHPQTLQKWLKS